MKKIYITLIAASAMLFACGGAPETTTTPDTTDKTEVTAEPTADAATAEPAAEEPATEVVAEDATAEPATEVVAEDATAEPATAEPAAEEPATEAHGDHSGH